jgi:hypothetical protein
MFITLLISSVILVGIIMLALSVKLLFDKNAEFSADISDCSINI